MKYFLNKKIYTLLALFVAIASFGSPFTARGQINPDAVQNFQVQQQAAAQAQATALTAAQQQRSDAIHAAGLPEYGPYTVEQETQISNQIKKETAAKAEDEKTKSGGGWWRWLYPGNWIPIIMKAVDNAILTLMGWLTGICGLLFNIVLQQTVVSMSVLVNALPINDAWTLLRDFANMFFIFIMLYIAIGTILKIDSINTRKLVANLIMAALFINFSLFITKAVIDASNLLAYGFYRQMPGLGTDAFTEKSGLSGTIMSAVKITSLYDSGSSGAGLANSMATLMADWVQFQIATIMGSIFLLILDVIFIAGAVMFVIRFVVLIILMITSPLMFAAMILPQMSHLSQKWFKAFWNQIIFAPAFMLFVLISLRFLTSPGFKQISKVTDNTSFVDIFANGGLATIGIIFNYGVIVSFLVASLIISKSLGHSAGGVAVGLMDKARKGVQGFAGRQTIGRVGQLAEDRLKNSKLGNSMVGRTIRENTTGAMYGAKFGSDMSREQEHKLGKEIKAKGLEIQQGKTLAQATRAHSELIARRDAHLTSGVPPLLPAEHAALQTQIAQHEDTIHKTMRSMTPKQIEGLKGDIQKHPEVLRNMDETDFNHLMKSENISEADKAELRTLKVKPLTDTLNMPETTPAEVTAKATAVSTAVKAMSDKQVASLDASLLTNPAVVAALGDRVHTIGKDDISPGTRDLMRKARLKPIEDSLATPAGTPGGDVGQAIRNGKFKPKEIAKMPDIVLTNPRFMNELTPQMLTEMAGEITPATMTAIRSHITGPAPGTQNMLDCINWLNSPAGQIFT